jgi:hypothetical protein
MLTGEKSLQDLFLTGHHIVALEQTGGKGVYLTMGNVAGLLVFV